MRASALALGVWVTVAQMGAAGEAKPSRPAVTWREVAAALSVLPSPEKAKHPGRYRVREKERSESRSRIESLKKKGDIIPPIVDRLKQHPKNERDEAEMYNLVLILKENLDERALPALEQLAASTPVTTYIMRDEGGKRYRYPYHLEARELARQIRVDRAVAAWEDELQGAEREERIRILADAWWTANGGDADRKQAAGTLLSKLPREVWVETAIQHAPPTIATDADAKQAYRILSMIGRHIGRGKIDLPDARAFVERMSRVEKGGNVSEIPAWELKSEALRILKESY